MEDSAMIDKITQAQATAGSGDHEGAHAFYPSLHANLGDDYLRLGNLTQAREHLTTRDLQELPLGRVKFGWMPMPSVLQGGISSHADIAQQLVGCGSTDVHTRHQKPYCGS